MQQTSCTKVDWRVCIFLVLYSSLVNCFYRTLLDWYWFAKWYYIKICKKYKWIWFHIPANFLLNINTYLWTSYYSLINSLVGTQGTSHLLTWQQYRFASLTGLSLHSNNINVSCGYFFLYTLRCMPSVQ